jgi:hypothetical protein
MTGSLPGLITMGSAVKTMWPGLKALFDSRYSLLEQAHKTCSEPLPSSTMPSLAGLGQLAPLSGEPGHTGLTIWSLNASALADNACVARRAADPTDPTAD